MMLSQDEARKILERALAFSKSEGMEVSINGANGLACTQLIQDVGTSISLEPIRGLPVIKDLVVDMEPFFAQYRAVLPYLINTDDPGYKERYQSPEAIGEVWGQIYRHVWWKTALQLEKTEHFGPSRTSRAFTEDPADPAFWPVPVEDLLPAIREALHAASLLEVRDDRSPIPYCEARL